MSDSVENSEASFGESSASSSVDYNDVIVGTDGNDALDGYYGDDTVSGDAGEDTLDGGAGADELDGGAGDDSISGGVGNDTILGGTGADTISGGLGGDSVSGGEGSDSITGEAGQDTIDGGAGDDTINGGHGNDSLSGGDGNDSLIGEHGDDTIEGGDGDDAIDGGVMEDSLSGDAGNDTIHGGTGDDIISGGDDNDSLFGDAGSDVILGGAGDDYIDGGTHNDTIYANEGADTVVGGQGADEISLGLDTDRDVLVVDAQWGGDIVREFDAERDVLYLTDPTAALTTTFDADTNTLTLQYGRHQVTLLDVDGSVELLVDRAWVNDGPLVRALDAGSVAEHGTVAVNLLAGQRDADGDTLSAINVSAADDLGAAVAVTVTDGVLSFDPASVQPDLRLGESRTISISYEVSDGIEAIANTATLVIVGENDAPTLAIARASVAEGVDFSADLAGLAGDADSDDDASSLTYAITGNPALGVASLDGSVIHYDQQGAFEHLAEGQTAEVSVELTVTDQHGATAVNTAVLTVVGANDAPTLGAAVLATGENQVTTIDLSTLADDIDQDDYAESLTYTITGAPALGSAAITTSARVLEFTPGSDFDYLAAGETAEVAIEITATDSHGATVVNTVTVTVTGTNDVAVVTGTSTATVTEDDETIATGTLTVTDVDTGEAGFMAERLDGSFGRLQINADGNWFYDLDNSLAAVQALGAGVTADDVFTVTTLDGTTQDITVTVTGTNDAAKLFLTPTATYVSEDGVAPPNYALNVSDADAGEASIIAETIAGNYGTFTFNAGGSWSYVLDNSSAQVQALRSGQTVTDTVTARALDGTNFTFSAVVTGTNDAPVITAADAAAEVTGDIEFHVQQFVGKSGGTLANMQAWAATPSAYGLTIYEEYASTLDYTDAPGTWGGVANRFPSETQTGVSGSNSGGNYNFFTYSTADFTVVEDGQVTFQVTYDDSVYVLIDGVQVYGRANSWGTVNFSATLSAGEHTIEVYQTDTGGPGAIQLKVLDTDGNFVLMGEDNLFINQTATGTVTFTDVDANDTHTVAVTAAASGYSGELTASLDAATGVVTWDFAISDADYAALPDGTHTQTYTVAVKDSAGAVVTQTVTVNIAAENDVAKIEGTSEVNVTEDNETKPWAKLTVTDADTGEASFVAATITSNYGFFKIDAAGNWFYDLDNRYAAIQALAAGETLTDTATVRTVDGTTATVSAVVTGINDAAVISGTSTVNVTEDNETVPTAKLTVTDVDAGEASFVAATITSNYGIFKIDAAGNWTYDLDNRYADIQALAAGQTLTDTATVRTVDGTTKTLSAVVTGVNDGPVIGLLGGDTSGSVAGVTDLTFHVQQFTGGGQSNSLSWLQSRSATPSNATTVYTAETTVIDYADTTAYNGYFAGSTIWPGQAATGQSGTDSAVNANFYAKTTANFTVTEAGTYDFRMYLDDGGYLLIDGKTVISNGGYASPHTASGSINLGVGQHTLEVYNYDAGGTGVLELSAKRSTDATWQLLGEDDMFLGQTSFSDSGSFTFTDTDTTNTHTVTVAAKSNSYGGTFTAVVDNATDTVTWSFNIDYAGWQKVAQGASQQSYTLTLKDSSGASVSKTVTVDIDRPYEIVALFSGYAGSTHGLWGLTSDWQTVKIDDEATGLVTGNILPDVAVTMDGYREADIFVEFNGDYYFQSATTLGTGQELMKLDADTGEVSVALDINPSGGSAVGMWSGLVKFDGSLWFTAQTGNNNYALYKWDGTGDAERIEIASVSGVNGYVAYLSGMFEFAGDLYFSGADAAKTNLYRIEGGSGDLEVLTNSSWSTTLSGITEIASNDLSADSRASEFSGALIDNGNLYFAAKSDTGTQELFMIDGDNPDTVVQISNFNFSSTSTTIGANTGLAVFNGDLYFSSNVNWSTGELYRMDLETYEVERVAYGNGQRRSNTGEYSGFVEFNGDLYFNAKDGGAGLALFRVEGEGANAGTAYISANWAGNTSNYVGMNLGLVEFNGKLYFDAFNGSDTALWALNSSGGLERVENTWGIDLVEDGTVLEVVNGALIYGSEGNYVVFDGTTATELDYSNGLTSTESFDHLVVLEDSFLF